MLTGLFCVLSAMATALTYGLQPDLSLWWIPGLLVGYYLAVCIVYILVLLLFTLCLPRRDGYSPVCRWLLVWSIRWALPFLRCRLRVSGLENLPDEPFLLVGNHVSNLDPMLALAAIPRRKLAFVSKPENFRYPIAGGLIRRSGFLAIDRENPRNAVATIHQAAEMVKRGICMGIYPEGTRNKSGKGLLPFHAGSFKIAKLAHCPTVVVATQYECPGFLGFKRAQVTVTAVLDTAYVDANRTDALSARTQELLTEALTK